MTAPARAAELRPSAALVRAAFVSLPLTRHPLVNAHIADAGDRLRR